jgi:uncharacterized BrkB/YihY/UPF0761 family membrane protein
MKPIQDERIIAERRALSSRAFGWIYLALWAMVLRRQLILEQPIQEYWDLFALTLFASGYLFIGLVRNGLYQSYRSQREKRKNLIIGAVVATIAFTLSLVFGNDRALGIDLLIGGVIFLVTWLGIQWLAIKISQDRSEKDIDREA